MYTAFILLVFIYIQLYIVFISDYISAMENYYLLILIHLLIAE